MEPRKDWAALARQIKRRRVVLGYQRQKSFAEQLPFSTRLLGELENGRRDTYDDSTLHALEGVLHWAPGSISAILAGGEPEELSPPVPASSPLAEMTNAELVAHAMSAVTELARRLPEETPGRRRPEPPRHAEDAPDTRVPGRRQAWIEDDEWLGTQDRPNAETG